MNYDCEASAPDLLRQLCTGLAAAAAPATAPLGGCVANVA
jgi:hypothetical protein